MNGTQTFVRDVGVSGLVDIAFIALVIYALLVWLKRTRRAALVVAGIVIVAAIYLLAQQFNLQLTVAMLQGFFAVSLVALVIIFQEEFRYFFERIAHWGLRRGLRAERRAVAGPMQVETLVRTVSDLAAERIGALIVLGGDDALDRHLEGGERLGGETSEAILKSLFDPHSIGHDGAVIVAQGLIERFGCHLPLSKNRKLLRNAGTRHAAALGLAERTDALCLVVSEERGRISVARHGELRAVDGPELRRMLESFLEETGQGARRAVWRELLTSNVREKIVAAGLAVALWFVLVHGSRTVYRTFRVPVELAHVPSDMRVASIEPGEVEVTFSASRKSFFMIKPKNIALAVRTWDLEPGSTRVAVAATDLSFPKNLVLENVKPRDVVIDLAVRDEDTP